jgi:hypothetical protein
MPYEVRKVKGGYKAAHKGGKTYSKHPQSKETARKQIQAIAIHTHESRNGAFHEGASHR